MFLIYIYRELRRRHRQALLTALGLAVGVGLVVAVTAYAGGVSKAQGTVLHSLYGVGTDITVTQTAKLSQGGPQSFQMNPGSQSKQGKALSTIYCPEADKRRGTSFALQAIDTSSCRRVFLPAPGLSWSRSTRRPV